MKKSVILTNFTMANKKLLFIPLFLGMLFFLSVYKVHAQIDEE